MDPQKEIEAVLKKAIDAVKAANDGVLGADELMLWLAAEIVARDRTLAEAGKVIPERIAANLDMDSRRREVALRAEVETLSADRDRLDWLESRAMQAPNASSLDDLLTRTGWPDLRAAIDAARND